MAIIDIVLIALLVIFAIIGLSKGFVKQVGKFISIVGAVVAAILLVKIVGNVLYSLDMVNAWESNLITELSKNELFAVTAKDASKEVIKQALDSWTGGKLPGFIEDILINMINFDNIDATETLAFTIGGTIVQYGCCATAFLGVFILTWIVLAIIVKAISKAIDVVPGAGFFNRLLGMVLSAGKIALIIWVVLYGLDFLTLLPGYLDTVTFMPDLMKKLSDFLETGISFINGLISKSIVCKYANEYNGVRWIISKFLTK